MKKIIFNTILLFICSVGLSQRVGLVFSGGGAAGFAHIGVLKALEENNIPIDFITGASAGDADAKAAAATEITASGIWTNGTNDDVAYFVVVDDNSTGIFKYVEAGGTEVEAAELTLIATADEVLVAATDFTF